MKLTSTEAVFCAYFRLAVKNSLRLHDDPSARLHPKGSWVAQNSPTTHLLLKQILQTKTKA